MYQKEKKMKIVMLFVIGLLVAGSEIDAQTRNGELYFKLDTQTKSAYDNRETNIPIIIWLNKQVPIEQLKSKLTGKKSTRDLEAIQTDLKALAASEQAGIAELFSRYEKGDQPNNVMYFWIRNMISARVNIKVLEEIAKREEVESIWFDSELQLDEFEKGSSSKTMLNNIEESLQQINATELWEMGFRGEGVLVMNIDTGVMGTHPALAARWRGNQPDVAASAAWFDPHGEGEMPYDNHGNGHGTHTMGTMVGMDEANNDIIGVAPQAQWIAARTISLGEGIPSTAYTLAAFQWALNPDGDLSTTNDIPDVINCSFYDPNNDINECGPHGVSYWEVLDVCEAAGIMVFFSAGNKDKDDQITPPKNRASTTTNIFCVGNMNTVNANALVINEGSCQGPSLCVPTGPLSFKPEVVAPGTDIRSATNDPDNPYVSLTGTSMAAPHVSGLAALYRQMYPEKTNTQIMEMLLSSTIEVQADQTFNMGEDNTYGMGFIDATHKSISTSFSAKDQAGNLIDGSFSISETYFGYSFEVDEFYVESGGSSNTSFGHNILNTIHFETEEEQLIFSHWSGVNVQFTNAHNLSTDFSITGPQARIVANYKKQGFTESKDALSSSARRLISTGKPESTTGFQSYSYKMAHMIYEDAGRIYYKWSHTDAKFNDIYWPEEFESFLVEGINPAITYSAFHDENGYGQYDAFSVVWIENNDDSFDLVADSRIDDFWSNRNVITSLNEAIQPIAIKYPINSTGHYCVLWPEAESVGIAVLYYLTNFPVWTPIHIELGMKANNIAAVKDVGSDDIHVIFDSEGDIYYIRIPESQLFVNGSIEPQNITASNRNLSNCTKPSIAINDDGIVLVGFQADAKYVIGTKPKRNDRPGAPSRRVYTRMLQGDQWHPFKEFSYNVTTNSVNPVVASEGEDFVIAWKVQGQDKIAYSKNDGGDDWRNWSTYQTITASGIDYPALSSGTDKIFMAYTEGSGKPYRIRDFGYNEDWEEGSSRNIFVKSEAFLEANETKDEFSIGAYPNPFNPTTRITFTLPETATINLNVYSVTGQLVQKVVKGSLAAGKHNYEVNGHQLATGLYFYVLKSANYNASGKLLLIK
jgi:subtilisin family serine protease